MSTTAGSITIRPAYPDDAVALARLAALDSQPLPAGELVVAERDGALLAAVATTGGPAIADPFVPTVHLVELLRVHVGTLAGRRPTRRGRAGLVGRRAIAVAAAR